MSIRLNKPLFFLLWLAACPLLSYAQWPTTTWTVVCSEQAKQILPAEDCDENNITSTAAFYRQQLEDASRWFQGHGFKAPAVPRDGNRFVAYLDDHRVTEGGTENNLAVYDFHQKALYLRSDTHFELDGPPQFFSSGVHELFHAIQYAVGVRFVVKLTHEPHCASKARSRFDNGPG